MAVNHPDVDYLPLTLSDVHELIASTLQLSEVFPEKFAVAVSGGADSMALVILLSQWAKHKNIEIIALTVDHGLRPESTAESEQVAQWCSSYAITHHTLPWTSPPLLSAIEEQARHARYQLLSGWCSDNNVKYLCTAHHRDDQAETLFFRLARGSGLDGLACMHPTTQLNNDLILFRPLLSVPKSRLVASLQFIHQKWLEDPSNINPHYTRSRIRAAINTNPHAQEILYTAYQITTFFLCLRKLLENNTARRLTSCTSYDENGNIMINVIIFAQLEPEYGLRVISAIVKNIGCNRHAPRTEKLLCFYKQLCSDIHTRSSKKRTLSHCLFTPILKKNSILVVRERKS